MKLFLAVMAFLTMAGCCAKSPDRAFFDAVAPEYAVYVRNDKTLTEEQRERRLRTVEAWDLSVREGSK